MRSPKQIVSEILDKGLADSTWREQYPQAYENLLTYREDLIRSFESIKPTEYHFFTSSQANWETSPSLYTCLRNQRRADKRLKNFIIKGCNVFKVPLPNDKEHPYDIDNFTPQVEGTEWLHYEKY